MGLITPPACSSLCRASDRHISLADSSGGSDFTFVIVADPQLGLLESYIEKRPFPYGWDRDLLGVNKGIHLINQLEPKPSFVIVCGDMVHATPGCSLRQPQLDDLMQSFSKLDPQIQLLVLPGNHDVNDHPTAQSVQDYRDAWGDDYFSLSLKNASFLVLNSQYLFDGSKCPKESAEFHAWLDKQLSAIKEETNRVPILFQHIPFFVNDVDEADEYFNLPKRIRTQLLKQFHESGIRYVFSGHLHQNSLHSWTPPAASSDPLHLITTSSLFTQLGSDKPGIRLVRVSASNHVTHAYWSLDELESLFAKGEQPSSTRA